MDEATNLKFLIRAKYGTIRKFAKVVGLSENTIRNHLKDRNWDIKQVIMLIEALSIPHNMIFTFFFESMLSENENLEAR